jgi:hypothetical protein
VGGVCRFLTAQAAINFAHAGGKVTVPMSQNANPTPWFEKIAIATNSEGSALAGLNVCATVAIGQCEPKSDPARFALSTGTSWGKPPVAHQGQAIKMVGNSSTSLFTRTFDSTGAPTVGDLTGLSVDLYVEPGGCPASDPRITLRIDTNGDGTADLNYHVYPHSSFTCPVGQWAHIDYITSNKWGGSLTKAAANTALGAHSIISMNLIWDGAAGNKVAWVDNQRYQNAFFREASDACDGDARNPTCAAESAQAGTIIDATLLSPTAVDIDASSVTFQGFTVRRTAPPVPGNVRGIDISGASAPTIKGNAVRMQGGGCNAGGLSGGGCTSGPQSIGIFAGAASSGAQIVGNTITASPASSDQSFGGTNGIQATLTGSSLITGNNISGWGANGASIAGSGAGVIDNTFQGNGDGVAVCASNARVNNNDFLGHASAVVACTGGTGLVMRDNNMDTSNSFGVRFPAGVSGMTIDARLNYWGVSEARLLPLRVVDQQGALSGNKVLQTPFRPNPVP